MTGALRLLSCAALALAGWLELAHAAPSAEAAAEAASAAAPESFDYVILRNGSKIGDYKMSIVKQGKTEDVSFTTDVKVDVLMFTAYRLRHSGEEIWKDGKFLSYQGVTNDNGKQYRVSLTPSTNGTQLTINGAATQLPKGVLPATFWNLASLEAKIVIDPDDGKVTRISTKKLGAVSVTIAGAPQTAQLYHVAGLNRYIWMANGVPVRIQLKGSDNSTIVSELQPASQTQSP